MQSDVKLYREITSEAQAALAESGVFDATWYSDRYPDVALSGMDPWDHFRTVGFMLGRDPGPRFSESFHQFANPRLAKSKASALMQSLGGTPAEVEQRRILQAASHLQDIGEADLAEKLLHKHLPAELAYSAAILRANAALATGDEDSWLQHLNAYLQHDSGIAPLRLTPGLGAMTSRLATAELRKQSGGPLVSVIMPAWNAAATVEGAARSILNQTWQNIELLIVDDCSSDNTWQVLQKIAASDDRVKIRRNTYNVGPYVSKNLALRDAKGEWVTGQDADDWSHPQRIERHLGKFQKLGRPVLAGLTYMIRILPSGRFGHIGPISGFSVDGVKRKSSISCLFHRATMMDRLGYWDSVRFGADSEMIARTMQLLGDAYADLPMISMVCLDLETSLTNHAEFGVSKTTGISPVRASFRDAWDSWHKSNFAESGPYVPFPMVNRRYAAPAEMVVPLAHVEGNL
ncbi:glycosyltransferase family 2 protein [Paracoccus xiamenensis]|uniref:glycosyltransferase family 2 protein n=1 Tax=Paracoccus xiamenensis TaxID=2714901 RepID=UPI00140C363A|nr:glycosyltransferase family 2 protein [Paracoccus xiamenensis]NHF74020.1 glycosyltransferase family 2 protein [Paracoccus xiamenensis]